MSAGSFLTPPVAAKIAASFSRPANTTAYSAGDLIANSEQPGEVAPLVFEGCSRRPGIGGFIRDVRLHWGGGDPVGQSIELWLWLFTSPQNVATGDNGPFLASDGNAWIGKFPLGASEVFSNGRVAVPLWDQEIVFDGAGDVNLYGYLTAQTAFTPLSADTFTVTLSVLRD